MSKNVQMERRAKKRKKATQKERKPKVGSETLATSIKEKGPPWFKKRDSTTTASQLAIG